MSKAVQFDAYGDVDVLQVRDIPRPVPAQGEVLVEVKAAGINPGEAMIRRGALHDRFPATFPSGQGSDLAGVVAEIGTGVQGFAAGDEVIGFSERRSSQAEFVVVPAGQLTRKPATVPCAIRLRAASPSGRIDAFLDLFGGGYVELAVDELGVSPERVDTIIDFPAIERFGVKGEGNADASDAAVLAELAGLIAAGDLDVPIAGVFPLDRVRDAYRKLDERHTRGKLVLSNS